MDRQFAAVLVCFALSGFAALLYQTAWLREFAFVFGTAELAVVSVLAAYMAGLALGSAIAARFAARIRRPVLVYGALELGIAAAALAVPGAIGIATRTFGFVLGGQPAPPDGEQLTGTLFFAVSSFLILAVPTGLMGVTLPLLARYAVRKREEIGARIGLLYAINTAGAVAGTLCAAFLLLPTIGLRQTLHVGVATNGLVFLVAAAVARSAPTLDTGPARTRMRRADGRSAWILPIAALSGTVSFAFEVLWTRLIGQILGGSVYAFATMLASFLLGITLGSAVASRFASSRARSVRGFAIAQFGTAAASLAAYAALGWAPAWARAIGAGSYGALLPNAAIAAAFLLPAASFIGATFPFAVRILARDEAEAPAASARVYAWNTSGAIFGAMSAGLFFLPALGFEGLIRLASATNLALGLGVCAIDRGTLRISAPIALAGLGALLLVPPEPPWRILRTNPGSRAVATGAVAHYGVGRSATVLLLDAGTSWRLTTNGLNEAEIRPPGSRPGEAATARWLALLPILARPESESILLVGLGGGLTLQAVPASVKHIDAIELEPQVVAANRAVADLRDSDPLSDPRVRLIVNDARGALMLTTRRYDAVVSQPSHPWTAGASHLYTREFFSLVREHLNPGGVFTQWIGLRFVDEELLRLLVATLQDTFEYVRLYQPVASSVVFLASDAPLPVERTASVALAAAAEDFERFGLRTPEDAAAGLVLNESGAREFARGARVNTDHDNRLAARSPRLLPRDSVGAKGADAVFAPYHPMDAHADDLRAGYIARRTLIGFGVGRAERYIAAMADPAAKTAAQGWVHYVNARPAAARASFERSLELAPDSVEGRSGLLLLARSQIVGGRTTTPPDRLTPLDALETAVLAGWSAYRTNRVADVRSLEVVLAEVDSRHPLYPECARLRAAWRLESGRRELAAEALEILDAITAVRPVMADILLRAQAAVSAGHAKGAVSSIEEIVDRVNTREQAVRALNVLAAVPDGVAAGTVARLRERLRQVR